jgi:hypothetical protein
MRPFGQAELAYLQDECPRCADPAGPRPGCHWPWLATSADSNAASPRDDGVVALVAGKHLHARPHRDERVTQRSPWPVLQRAASRWHLLKDT